MFKWMKRISFFKQYREPVDIILKGLQAGKFEISTKEEASTFITMKHVVLRHGACEILITLTEYSVPFYTPKYTSSTDDWMTKDELQAVYGLAVALYNIPAWMKEEKAKRMKVLAVEEDQKARMDEVKNQLKEM